MTYRKIGLIGDIHAEESLLEQAVGFLKTRGVDLIVSTGDILDGRGSVDKCCRILRSNDVVTIRGNHDRWFLAGSHRTLPDATPMNAVSTESRQLLEELPQTVEIETVKGRALLCHGLGLNDMAKVTPDDFGYALEANNDLQKLIRDRPYRWILNGHSHKRMVRDFNGVTIVNAGTLKRMESPCFFELDFETSVAWLYEVDSNGPGSPRRHIL